MSSRKRKINDNETIDELTIHLPYELSNLIHEYADMERYVCNDNSIRIYYSLLFNKLHGTIDIYALKEKTIFDQYKTIDTGVNKYILSVIRYLFRQKQSSDVKNVYLCGKYKFKCGKLDGEQLHLDSNGNKTSSHHFFNGVLNGPAFYPGASCNYVNGVLDGLSTFGNESGHWSKGKKIGPWGIPITDKYGSYVRSYL